jgi:NADH dehydrogenase
MGPVAITGANSAVGRAMLELASGGADSVAGEIVACVRSERAESQLPALGPATRVARVDYDDANSLVSAFRGVENGGVESVVHLPGVLVESPGSTYERANVATTRAVVDAARTAGVRKLVLVSALGADPGSANRYYRTKGEAESLVRDAGLAWTILRAPLVLGPGTEGAAALRRNASGSSVALPGGGRQRQQPLDVADLARAAFRAAEPGLADSTVLDVAGRDGLSDADLVRRAARELGHEVRVRSAPLVMLRLLLRLRGAVGASGFSADALDVITTDTDVDPKPACDALGLELTPLDDMLRRSLEAS